MKTNDGYEIGDVVELCSVRGTGPLPEGVNEGFQVRLVAFDQNHRIVERNGREWRVCADHVRSRRQPVAHAPMVRPSACPRRSVTRGT